MDAFTIAAPLAGWVTPLGEVPDPVFAERMLGDGVAIDPTGDTLFAPCDGEILTLNDARHALSLRCDNGAEIILHLGIDTVALSGVSIEALVQPLDRVNLGDPLLKFDLDYLVQHASAVVTPMIVCDAERFSVEVLAHEIVSPGDALLRVRTVGARSVAAAVEGPVRMLEVEVALPHGIHARPAAKIVEAVRQLKSTAFLLYGGKRASAVSPVAMLGLGAGRGAKLKVEVSGPDAEAALAAIAAILHDQSDKEETAGPIPPSPGKGPGLAGVPAAPGLAIGPAFWLRTQSLELSERSEEPGVELEKLDSAISQTRSKMEAAASQAGPAGAILAAQLALLDDPTLLDAAHAEIAIGASAAGAWRKATEAQAAILTGSGDRRIAERAEDIRDIEARVLSALLGSSTVEVEIPDDAILLAEELLPSQVVMLDPTKVGGIALVRGGPTSHASILAAGMGIPMAVAFGSKLERVETGTTVILDADSGRLEPNPPSERLRGARTKLEQRSAAEAAARDSSDALCHTSDGTRVEIFANLGSVADAQRAVEQGAEGCGLLRTEFLFLDRADAAQRGRAGRGLPGHRRRARRPAAGRPHAGHRRRQAGAYLALPAEENPALGVRGVRVGLANRSCSRPAAGHPARDAGRALPDHGADGREPRRTARRSPCRTMRPARADGRPTSGVMVETPAAAMTADLLARRPTSCRSAPTT